MAVDKRFLRQQIVTQIERCTALGYAAGQHFLLHGEHTPASMLAQAEADARLIQLIEDYAALGVNLSTADTARMGNEALAWHCKRGCPHPDVCEVVKFNKGGECKGARGVAATAKTTDGTRNGDTK